MDHIYRIGIVGTGGIAHAHGQACQSLPHVTIQAICDVKQEALDRYGETFGVSNRYTSLDTMLEAEDLDIAIICTWGHYHAEGSNTLARSRKVRAILCEKPFCRNAEEARNMAETAQENGILLAEAFKFRHHPQHLKMKAVLESGRLGKLETIRSTFFGGTPENRRRPELNWRFNKIQGGGAIYDLGCYCIHHARFIAGADPVKVYAIGHTGHVSEVDESVSAVMEFPGEVHASFNIGFRSFGSQAVEIYGTEGVLRCAAAWNNENRPVTVTGEFRDGRETYDFNPVNQFALQLEHLCHCLETGEPHRISNENSINQMRTIDALFESIATEKEVRL